MINWFLPDVLVRVSKMRKTSSMLAVANTFPSLPGCKDMPRTNRDGLLATTECNSLVLIKNEEKKMITKCFKRNKTDFYADVWTSWIKTFPFRQALKTLLLVGDMTKHMIKSSCFVSIWIGTISLSAALFIGHRRTMKSYPPEAKNIPSSEKSIELILLLSPTRFRLREARDEWRWFGDSFSIGSISGDEPTHKENEWWCSVSNWAVVT